MIVVFCKRKQKSAATSYFRSQVVINDQNWPTLETQQSIILLDSHSEICNFLENKVKQSNVGLISYNCHAIECDVLCLAV